MENSYISKTNQDFFLQTPKAKKKNAGKSGDKICNFNETMFNYDVDKFNQNLGNNLNNQQKSDSIRIEDTVTFKFGDYEIPVLIDSEHNPFFIARDVCSILEVNNVSQAISRLDVDEKGIILNDTLGGMQEVSIINESGLYSLVLSSRKQEAKAFKKWITSEVLPAIRKHGAYMTEKTLQKTLTDPDFIIQLATQLKTEREEKARFQQVAELQERELKLQAPKAKYYDEVLTSKTSHSTTLIAKELGMTAQKLNKILKDNGVQYYQGGVWVLYAKYQDKGFTTTRTSLYTDNQGVEHTSMLTVWTEKGREFIHSLIKQLNAA